MYVLDQILLYTPNFLVVLACVLIVSYMLYMKVIIPVDRIKHNEDVGYMHQDKIHKRTTANLIRRNKKIGDIPPVYPNGWYGLCESFRVDKEKAINVDCLGLNLAVFRDLQDIVHVVDAYCPHMGANLGVDGQVIDNCIECPLHGWRFRGHDGQCMQIPYTDKIPTDAKLKTWMAVELNGWIHMWYHAEGIAPTWSVPLIEDIADGWMRYKGRAEHYINAHIQDISANAADISHLTRNRHPFVHLDVDTTLIESRTRSSSFMRHEVLGKWGSKPTTDPHLSYMKVEQKLHLLGRNIAYFNIKMEVHQIGPGLVHIPFDSYFGRGVFQVSILPVRPLLNKMVYNIYHRRSMTNVIAKFLQTIVSLQVERDILVWNNKTYRSQPLWTNSEEDVILQKHRQWFSQFYSENSPRLNYSNGIPLDW